MTLKPVLSPRKPEKHTSFGELLPVCRLGLATRGGTHLLKQDVLWALERGINYLNWPGHEDGMSEAIRSLSPRQTESLPEVETAAKSRPRQSSSQIVVGS